MDYHFTIEPGAFNAFADEAALVEQCQAWSLLSDKAVKSKAFVYKRGGISTPCSIIGFVDELTAVIEFENKQRHCIHPSFLKEMQTAQYGLKAFPAAEQVHIEQTEHTELDISATTQDEESIVAAPADTPPAAPQPKTAPKPVSEKPAKKKSSKLQLPEEKVKLTARVKEFAAVPNHFTEEDDEVIIYENVTIIEPELELGDAWSSNSATLKKFELEAGDIITFEAKVVAKKLTKHPVPYKINNPSKITKA